MSCCPFTFTPTFWVYYYYYCCCCYYYYKPNWRDKHSLCRYESSKMLLNSLKYSCNLIQPYMLQPSLRILREKYPGVNWSLTASSALLHSCPPTCELCVTQWSHSTHTNPCSLPAGNAAVLKPSELSEYSSLLLRALLPRYLDKVWTPAAIVDGVMLWAAVTLKPCANTVQCIIDMFYWRAKWPVWGDSLLQQWLILPWVIKSSSICQEGLSHAWHVWSQPNNLAARFIFSLCL